MEFDELSRAVLADVSECLAAVDPAQVAALAEALAESRRVFLIGTGRSGKMLEAMAVRLGHLGITAHVVGSPDCPEINSGDLVLVGSGSGATPVSLELATGARDAGAGLAVITAAPDSPIARLADTVIHIPAPAPPHGGGGRVEFATGKLSGLAGHRSPRDPAPSVPMDGTPHTLRSLFEECLLIVCDCVCRMLQDRLGLSTDDMQERHSLRE